MELTFAPNGILQIDDARITHRNFAGRATQYNREGERNFSLIIEDEELANRLIDEGWNVKIKPSTDPDAPPRMHLPVKVRFNNWGPNCYLISGNNQRKLDEDSVGCFDYGYILRCDLDIRPRDWEFGGKTGRTAYLHSIRITQEVDRFAVMDDEY